MRKKKEDIVDFLYDVQYLYKNNWISYAMLDTEFEAQITCNYLKSWLKLPVRISVL